MQAKNPNYRFHKMLLLGAAACGLSCATASAGVVFSDTFGGSTMASATNSPTATSTNYDIGCAKDGTASSIASGDLKVAMVTTTGGIVEAQALFTTTPVALTNIGDFINLTTTFTDTTGNPVAVYFGLFNSHGSAPLNNLMNGGTTGTNPNSGLSSSQTNAATGGAAGWTGYSDIIQSSASSKIASRPAQSTGSNTSQDLLSNNASSSQSYQGGTTIGASVTAGAVAAMTAGNTYTEAYMISLSAAGQYTITSNLYSGSNTSGTLLATISENDSTFLYNNFDGLAMGWRETGGSATQFDFSSLTVSVAPEPSALGLLGLAGLGIRRRK